MFRVSTLFYWMILTLIIAYQIDGFFWQFGVSGKQLIHELSGNKIH